MCCAKRSTCLGRSLTSSRQHCIIGAFTPAPDHPHQESFGLKHDPDNFTASNSILLSAQGALDGGLDIPHSEKRFVGYSAEDKSLDAETLRKHIYGGHVAEYMEEMQEEAPEKYQVRPHTA